LLFHRAIVDRPSEVHRYPPGSFTLFAFLLLLVIVMMMVLVLGVGVVLPRAPSKLTANEFLEGHPSLSCC
jgi:hypothetical protein